MMVVHSCGGGCMGSDRRKKAEELFQVVLDLSVEQRAGYLDQQCGSDAALRSNVEQLVSAAESDTSDFMRSLPPIRPIARPGDPPSDRLTEMIGRYRVERELGHGGMGIVYLAMDNKLDRHVAIKLLPDEFSHDPHRLALFEREARTAAHLNHPNIGTIYELGEVDGSFFIAMEYVEGRPLTDLLEASEPIPLPEFLDIAIQIAQGLTAAHGSNVVHRDLKPGNLMITDESLVKILDFGLAKALRTDAGSMIATGATGDVAWASTCFGTAGYSSPEQCSGDPVDLRSDLFSFGVVLYELATGVPPFKRSSLPDTISAVLNEQPKPPDVINSELPSDLAQLIGKLLAKRPENRYQSSADVLDDLQKVKHRIEAPRHRRLKLTTIALGVAVILLVIIMPFVWVFGPRQEDPKLMQLERYIEQTDVASARTLIDELENEWGEDDERLIGPRQDLNQLIDVLMAGEFRNLEVALRNGEFDDAVNEIVSRVCWLDEYQQRCDRAKRLYETAQRLEKRTEQLDDEGSGHIGRGELNAAAQSIRQLNEMSLKGRIFIPARTRAKDLSDELITVAEDRAQAHLDAPREPSSESFMERISATRALLQEFDPQNRYLNLFKERLAELTKLADLRTASEKAKPGMTPTQLDEILRRMRQIDPDHDLTKSVERMYDLRLFQTTTFAEGLNAFAKAWMELLSRRVTTYEQDHKELPSSAADQELQQLTQARQWLDRYRASPPDLDHALVQARLLHDELNREIMSWDFPNFVDAAQEHLNKLLNECDKATARQEGQRLCDRITHLCERRLLVKAIVVRDTLDGLDVEGLDQQIAAARGLVEKLQREDTARSQAQTDFERFRGELQSRKRGYAKQTLVQLERAWRVERVLLDNALFIEERDELRLRRVVLNMRLGNYAEAFIDADRLPESGEALLWRSLARFAQSLNNPSGINEALVDVNRAIDLDGDSTRALYLRGMYGHELRQLGAADAPALEDIRTNLEKAVSELKLDSATACHHMAAVQLDLDEFSSAIDWATAALEAQFTEDGIVVKFGGNRQAVETDVVEMFQSDTYHARATGHSETRKFEACIRDCDRALELSEWVELYFLRGMAKLANKDKDGAVEDFKWVVNDIDPRTGNARLIKLRKDAQKVIEGKTK